MYPFGFEMGFFAVESEGAKLNDPGTGWFWRTEWLAFIFRILERSRDHIACLQKREFFSVFLLGCSRNGRDTGF